MAGIGHTGRPGCLQRHSLRFVQPLYAALRNAGRPECAYRGRGVAGGNICNPL